MNAVEQMIGLLRQGLHVPAGLRELVAMEHHIPQTEYQRLLAAVWVEGGRKVPHG